MTTVTHAMWYRRYRPRQWREVVGQPAVVATLKRAVQQRRIAHAYLFSGPRGTGKTTCARILANAINCERPLAGDPCGQCTVCTTGGIDVVEIDAASYRGIAAMRELRERVGFVPNASARRVYLLDEVQEFTPQAFDALLKTLEEPPEHIVFVLATTEPPQVEVENVSPKIPLTIWSRCQVFAFRPIPADQMVSLLTTICQREGVTTEPGALRPIVRAAKGGLRDAINLLEQAALQTEGRLTVAISAALCGETLDPRAAGIVNRLLSRDLQGALDAVAEVALQGGNMYQLTRDLIRDLRTLLLVRARADRSLSLTSEERQAVQQRAERHKPMAMTRAAKTLSLIEYHRDPYSPLPLELAIIELIAADRRALTTA